MILENTEFPENLPPYRDLIADGEGRIWVQLYIENRTMNVFDVFDPQEGFIARMILEGAPIDHSFAGSLSNRFSGQVLWQIEQDEEGYSSLVRYRLTAGRTSR